MPAAPKRQENPTVLTVKEYAHEMRISLSMAYEAVNSGQVPCVRFGAAIRIPRAVVDQQLATHSAA